MQVGLFEVLLHPKALDMLRYAVKRLTFGETVPNRFVQQCHIAGKCSEYKWSVCARRQILLVRAVHFPDAGILHFLRDDDSLSGA